MVGALANGKAGWRIFREFGENTSMPATEAAATTKLHRPADRPPRAQSLQPELQPAKRNIPTARNSRTHHPHQHIAASAWNTAPQTDPRAHNPLCRR